MDGRSQRIIIVGAGFAGLAIGTRLAQSGLPVTILEAGQLGADASTRNQGWLHSGAFFARDNAQLARQCYESLRRTIDFCPESIEPSCPEMLYVFAKMASQRSTWTSAWEAAGIPYSELSHEAACRQMSGVDAKQIQHAYQLPDRSFRPHVLLESLAAAAQGMGAEIRTQVTVVDLLRDDHQICGVRTGTGEELAARRVVLATGAAVLDGAAALIPQAGEQTGYRRVVLKTHLVSVQPELNASPFCVLDDDGFNHLPHWQTSVFGNGHWPVVHDAAHRAVEDGPIQLLWRQIATYFPGIERSQFEKIREWAGTTLQILHVDQIEPGRASLPTIINHRHEAEGLKNLWSVSPGRATLWAHVAEKFRDALLDDLGVRECHTAAPPWAAS